MKKFLMTTLALTLSATALADSRALAIAKASFLQQDSKLNLVWSQVLERDERAFLRKSQKQWLKNKDVVCGKMNANVSERKLISIYNCHRDMTAIRTQELIDIYERLSTNF